ncbi:MAG: 50S ribosomal protein L29 [Deltaproteobacteria bacterium]|nr:50S ribosomal protein L29 [Deltaproteobacteria bacterium]
MKATELRECTEDRLRELDKSLRREIFEARIKNFTNQLDDTASIRRSRRDLARVQTALRARAAAGTGARAPADGAGKPAAEASARVPEEASHD